MIALLLSTLFAATAVLAIAAIAVSLRRYGRAALSIRQQLRDCPDVREVRWSFRELVVRPAPAMVIRADFSRSPRHRRVLRAAA